MREVTIAATFAKSSESFLRRVKIFVFKLFDNGRSRIARAFRQINSILSIERSPKLLDFLQKVLQLVGVVDGCSRTRLNLFGTWRFAEASLG